MSWSLEFAPLLPLPALIAIGAVGVLLAAALLWRRTRGASLRIGVLALLLLALFNPSLRQEEREPLTDIAVVAVDQSASQKISGRSDMTARLRTALAEALEAVPNLEVRWVNSPLGSDGAERDGTTLFADISEALSDVPPDRLAGVVALTDGLIHDVPGNAEDLGIRVPLHAFITGDRGEVDRRIEIVRAPRYGLVGSQQTARIRVIDSPGEGSGGTAEIRITGETQSEVRRVPVGQTVDVPIEFPHAGTNIVELEVEAAPGELTLANNKAVLAAEGVREHLRVLLVSGEPHPGERVWRNLLKSDAAVDLVHFTILRPPEKQDGTPINQLSLIAFPTRELFQEKLDEFDLIIFDRYHRRGVLPLLYLDNVARFVEEGGAVLMAAGSHYASATSLYRTPLSAILPASPTGRVVEEPFRPAMTPLGLKHPVTRSLNETGGDPDWGRWFRTVEAETEGQVVMQGPGDRPLLVLDRRGEGRVALLLSDHAWLWSRGFEGGGPYTTLLRRLAHWLMKEPDLEEEMLRATGRGQTLIVERRSIEDEVGEVEITAPSGEKSTVTLDATAPGLWEKRIPVSEQGVYRLNSGELTAVTHVGTINSREFAQLTASEEPLRPMLDQTGGGAFWVGKDATARLDLPRIAMLRADRIMHGDDWLGLRKRDAYITRGVKLIPLFTGVLALALLLAAISLTWFREGR